MLTLHQTKSEQQLTASVPGHLESKADESESGGRSDFKAIISFNKPLEQLGQAQVMLDVLLQALLTISAQHKPDL